MYFISVIIKFIIISFKIVLLWKVFKIKRDERFVIVDTNRSSIKDDKSYGKLWMSDKVQTSCFMQGCSCNSMCRVVLSKKHVKETCSCLFKLYAHKQQPLQAFTATILAPWGPELA